MAQNRLRAGLVGRCGVIALLVAIVLVSSQYRAPAGTRRAQVKNEILAVPRGSASQIDALFRSEEWSGAAHVSIDVEAGWEVTVFLKHDAENLYLAFRGVEHEGKRLFPEILIDPEARRGTEWSQGQMWLHVSANLCEGNGEYNVYEHHGVFQCAHTKSGWEANNPPENRDVIEVRISFAKMGISEPIGRAVGLALDVTDATRTPRQIFRYWPGTAQIARPSTWGTAIFE
jgi:hypothetical protein